MRWLVTLLVVAAACSSSTKREDAPVSPTEGSARPPGAGPLVYVSTPSGELPVSVEVVSKPAQLQRGLMYREHLPLDGGMLFLMGDEADHSFYMRNTLIPLDIIFIGRDFTIAGIVQNAEPKTETLRRVGKPSLYVLEVNGGWTAAHHVGAGAKVRFHGVP